MTINIKNKEQWKNAFFKSCKDGNLEEVRHLCQKQYLDFGWADIHCYEDVGFRAACEYGHLDVVKYLLTSPKLKAEGHTFADLHAENEYGFRGACRNGHLKVVKYLLTSHELKAGGHSFANIHAMNEYGFRVACAYGQLEVVKYLLTSHELKAEGHNFADVHAHKDDGFREACEKEHWDLVRWLVMDYGMKKTSKIKEIIKEYPQAQEYFRVKEEMMELDEAMNPFMNNGLMKKIQSKVDSFIQGIKNMSGRDGFKKEQQGQEIENKGEFSNETEKTKHDEVKPKTKRL